MTSVFALDSAGHTSPALHCWGCSASARRAKERTYPEVLRAPRCRFLLLSIEVGGHWSAEAAQFERLLARSRPVRPHPFAGRVPQPRTSPGGVRSCLLQRPAVTTSLSSLRSAANVDGAFLRHSPAVRHGLSLWMPSRHCTGTAVTVTGCKKVRWRKALLPFSAFRCAKAR